MAPCRVCLPETSQGLQGSWVNANADDHDDHLKTKGDL